MLLTKADTLQED